MSDVVVPSSSDDRKRIHDAVVEASDSMLRIDAERSHIKSIKDNLNEEFDIPKPMLTRMIKTYYKDQFDEEQKQASNFEELYEAVMEDDS